MARYTFFTQAARDSSTVATSSEELVNCYPEIAPGDGRTRLNIRSVLGEQDFVATGYSQIRAAQQVNGVLYYVAQNKFYQIDNMGIVTELGTVAGGPNVTIRGNGPYVTIAANGVYYVWNGTALSLPVGNAFDDVGAVEFNDFDTILTEKDGKRFAWSATADPLTLNALYFASAEAREGNIIRPIADRTQLFLFCERHTEVWRNTGADGENRYQRLSVIDQGLKGYHLIVRDGAGTFFVGDDNIAYTMSGTGFQPVSTPAVNTDIEAGPLAVCYYEDRGHKFFGILFSDRPAWIYDVTTQVWHRRQTGVVRGAWGARRVAKAFDGWITFDDFGRIRKLARNNADGTQPLKRILRGKPLDGEGKFFSVSEFEVMGAAGQGANVMLRWSWDGGETWSDEITETLGGVGEYRTRARFQNLGRDYQFTPEVSITDPIDVVLYSDARVVTK